MKKDENKKAEERRQNGTGIPLKDWVDDEIDRSGPQGSTEFIYVDIGCIDRNTKQIVDPKELPVDKAPSRAKQVLRSGDVLVSMTRPNLNAVAMVPKHLNGSIGSTGFHVLRSKHADPAFIFYAVQSRTFIEAMCLKVQGALYPAVRPSDISAFCLPPFALARQRLIVAKIEELFSELEAGEESFRQARRQLGVYRQSLLKQAFEGKLTVDWRQQNPELLSSPDQLLQRLQAERQKRYEELVTDWEVAIKKWEAGTKSEKRPSRPKRPAPAKEITLDESQPLFSLPNCWVWLRFDSACYESVLGKMLDAAKNRGELKPYLKNINVRWGQFDLEDLFLIRIENTEIERYKANVGDLIICEGGEPGRCAVWSSNQDREVFLQKALHRVRFTPSVSPYFIELLMSFLASTKRLEKNFTGTTIKHLTGAGLAGVPVPLCSLPEQQEIVRLLDEQFTAIEQNEREIDAALKRSEALRQSILKKAFSGQLVPQDPTDEPASELLKRIQAERNATPTRKATRKV